MWNYVGAKNKAAEKEITQLGEEIEIDEGDLPF